MKRTAGTKDASQRSRRTSRLMLRACTKMLSDNKANSLVGFYWSFKADNGEIKKLEIGMELSIRVPAWLCLEKKLDGIRQNIQESTVFKTRLNNRRFNNWQVNGKRYLICGLSKIGKCVKYKTNGKIETKSNRGKNASSKLRSSSSTAYVDCQAICIIGIKACQPVQEEQEIFQCGRCLRTFKTQRHLDTHNDRRVLCRKGKKTNSQNSQKPKKKNKKMNKKKKKTKAGTQWVKPQNFVIAVLDVKHEHCAHELRRQCSPLSNAQIEKFKSALGSTPNAKTKQAAMDAIDVKITKQQSQ